MNKPSILKSVSISEMLHMREMGLSNAEIADKLGCSHATVIRHIGKAPFVKSGRGRKKKGSDALGLPPVGDKPIPEMPHESFKERCERMANELRCNPTHWVPAECAPTTAEIMAVCEERRRETRARLAEEPSLSAEPHKLSNPPLPSGRIDELVSVFGKTAVIEYIRCRLYEIGMNEDAIIIDHDGLLAKLNKLQGGEHLD